MVPTLILISMIIFVVIQLPPGDIVTSTLDKMQSQGVEVSAEQIIGQTLRAQYNLDKPIVMQYVNWIGGFIIGDMGYSYLCMLAYYVEWHMRARRRRPRRRGSSAHLRRGARRGLAIRQGLHTSYSLGDGRQETSQ